MEVTRLNAIGGVGEMLVAAAFLKRGIPVYRPVVDAGADLVADFGGKLQRIQVKSTADESKSLHIHLNRRSHNEGAAWVRYGSGELDWHAVCCLAQNYIALIPAGQLGATLTFQEGRSSERLAELEINAVLDRLLEEKDD